jgi:drug/metabolite transporter (DMT)-like permease
MFFANAFLALGNTSLSRGMKVFQSAHAHGLFQSAHAVINVYVIAGVVLLSMFLLLYLTSLSWEELSYVLPLTAASYVLVTILARFVLHEPVTSLRWAGVFFVATGVVLVAGT